MIAYIPREKNFYSPIEYKQFTAHEKTFCLQVLYKSALSNLVKAQKSTELHGINLKLGNRSKMVNMKIPIMFIIGDNQGKDTITGRPIHYGLSAKRISRTCDAGVDELWNPKVGSCKRIIMNNVMHLVADGRGCQTYIKHNIGYHGLILNMAATQKVYFPQLVHQKLYML